MQPDHWRSPVFRQENRCFFGYLPNSSLSILVVNCKNYVPSHDWYLCKSGMHFSAAAKTPDWPDYDEARHNEFNDSDDYVLMPECPGMTDEEAGGVVKAWCERHDIPYVDDLDNIEAAYRWYYKCDDYDDNDHALYVCHLCGTRR